MPGKRFKSAMQSRRTRSEPPTLDEAIFAAQGLSDDIEGQTEIAATLMGLQHAEVRPHVQVAASRGQHRPREATSLRPSRRTTVVVVERRTSRISAR